MEVIAEVDFHKSHQAAGPDGLSSSFYKDGDRVGIRVSKTPGIILSKGKDPKNRFASAIVSIYKKGGRSPSENYR